MRIFSHLRRLLRLERAARPAPAIRCAKCGQPCGADIWRDREGRPYERLECYISGAFERARAGA